MVFNKIFFPSFDPLVGSLAAFATFFVSYCARPLGGVLFGHFGDRVGRKVALLTTILMMGIGTVLIGLMPSALVQQLGPILGGGLSPLIATALFSEYGTPWTVAIYMVALAILSTVCAIGLKARHA